MVDASNCFVDQSGGAESEFRNGAGGSRVHLIDTPALRVGFRVGQGETPLAYDGVHPSVYGQALLAVRISVEVQKILNGEQKEVKTPG